MENKKSKQKTITKPIKEHFKKNRESIVEIFLKMKKWEQEIMLRIKTKICQIKTEKEKKNIEETASIKEKNFVGELENVGLNK